MKRTGLMTAVLLLTGFAALFAHAPAKIDLSFNRETGLLTVAFGHKVRDPGDHYIAGISVSLNGTEIILQKADLQDTADGGTFVYKIVQAKPGDTIEVLLECVKGGKMKKSLKIEDKG